MGGVWEVLGKCLGSCSEVWGGLKYVLTGLGGYFGRYLAGFRKFWGGSWKETPMEKTKQLILKTMNKLAVWGGRCMGNQDYLGKTRNNPMV